MSMEEFGDLFFVARDVRQELPPTSSRPCARALSILIRSSPFRPRQQISRDKKCGPKRSGKAALGPARTRYHKFLTKRNYPSVREKKTRNAPNS